MTKKVGSTSVKSLMDEQGAIASLKNGNTSGLAVLVRLHQVKAVHAALLIVNDRGMAEEIVQEAFLRAYCTIAQFDDRRPFGPWFLRSVIHASLKTAAKQKRERSIEEAQDLNAYTSWLTDPSLTPQEIMESAEQRDAIWQALMKLTPQQRAAIVLRYFLEEGESEMIQHLDRPLTTIKWWLYSARQRLRKELAPSIRREVERQEVENE